MSSRTISFKEALREAQELILERHPNAIIIGEGVPDPKAVFGTTAGLKDKFPQQVFDMPVSENGITGVCVGLAINGIKPILVHMRIDFALYSMDQIVNNAAKWFSMYGGQRSVALVIRMLVGRGWGQGNQHSQNLTALLAHVPGLKVVCPSNAYDAKGLLIAAFEDPNPVIFIEHRWLYETLGEVPTGYYSGEMHSAIHGFAEVTVVTSGYSTVESHIAEEHLEKLGVIADFIPIQNIRPLDLGTVKESLASSRRLIVVDDAWPFCGLASEIICQICEDWDIDLKSKPIRLTYPDYPSGSSPALTKHYYVGPADICMAVEKSLGRPLELDEIIKYQNDRVHDVPDANFRGPF